MRTSTPLASCNHQPDRDRDQTSAIAFRVTRSQVLSPALTSAARISQALPCLASRSNRGLAVHRGLGGRSDAGAVRVFGRLGNSRVSLIRFLNGWADLWLANRGEFCGTRW